MTCAILNFFVGGTLIYGLTVFFNPIRQTFGWSATTTSVAFSIRRLGMGIFSPVAGLLVDRVGPRKLMLFGWSMMGLGFFLMSRIDSLWAFYGTFLILAIGFCFGSFVVMATAMANWFIKKRSRALSFLLVGVGAGGTLVPLLSLAIGQFGWRTTLIGVSIIAWVIGIPLSSLMRNKPERYGYLPDGETTSETMEPDSNFLTTGFTVKAALRTRAFWLLSLAFFFQHLGTNAVMVHIVPYLESENVPTAVAATVVTGMTLLAVIGSLGFGFLGDITNKKHLIALAFILQTGGLFIFSFIDVDRTWLIILFLLIYAPGQGGPEAVRVALLGDYFGRKSFGAIMGLMAVISMLAGLISPIFAGWIFDIMGSYLLAWQLIALFTVPAIPLILLVKLPKAS